MRFGKALLASLTLALASAACHADDFSFTGNFNDINDVELFTVTIGSSTTLALITYGYGGGVNVAGQSRFYEG